MSIQESFLFDKSGEVVRFPLLRRFFLILVVILVAILAFGIGRLSGEGRASGVAVSYDPSFLNDASSTTSKSQAATGASTAASGAGEIFASSQGTKYYYPGCKSTVSEKNKVFFTSSTEAEQAGYTLAANCRPSQTSQ